MAGLVWMVWPSEVVTDYTELAYKPHISPDYSGTVFPANIAPCNFRIQDKADRYYVCVYGDSGRAIDIFSKTGNILIPKRPWKNLLAANKGKNIRFDVYLKQGQGVWKKCRPIVNTISADPIDDYVVYRRMKPIYNHWQSIGIFQYNLTNNSESEVLHGRSFGQGCLNCHSFVNNEPDTIAIGLRSAQYGSSTLLSQKGKVRKIGTKWGYTAWHPSGKLAVYSLNKVRQFFHVSGQQVRDVVDLDSALGCYQVEKQTTVRLTKLSDKERLETYPTWSPDGTRLYYCSAPILWQDRDKTPPENYDQCQYDLMCASYDADQDVWGDPETVLSAEDTGLSILLPRISPDGRFLIFCMCRYGCFPVYQPSSDLYIMDLSTKAYHTLPINSPHSESWHCWSSNGRWMAFSSKQNGGLFTRTYFSHVDREGKVYKPFVLPQTNPTFYDSLLETYSVPELIKGRITTPQARLARAARASASVRVPDAMTGATARAISTTEAWQERE